MLAWLLLACPLVTDADLAALRDLDGDGWDAESKGGRDCDDANADVNPGAEERCGGGDDDCDGLVDEADPDVTDALLVYDDDDGDGAGGDASARLSCEGLPEGAVLGGGDCDDDDALVHPEALELCDGIDQNCDGIVDRLDLDDSARRYPDLDGDGYGDPSTWQGSCDVGDGWTLDATDCDDRDVLANPGVAEIPRDGIDNDCDGGTDLEDADSDGLPDFPSGVCVGQGRTWTVAPQGADFTEIRDAVAAAQACDTVLIASGTYQDFEVRRSLRIIADVGARVEVVAEPLDDVGIHVAVQTSGYVLLDRITLSGFATGLRVASGNVTASVDIEQGGLGVEVLPALVPPVLELVSSTLTDLDQALLQADATVVLQAVGIENVLSPSSVLYVGGVAPNLVLADVTIRDCAAASGSVIGFESVLGVLAAETLLVEDSVGSIIEAATPYVELQDVTVRGCVSTRPGFLSLASGVLVGTLVVDGLVVERNAWSPPPPAQGEEPIGGLLWYGAVSSQTIQHVHFRDNVLPADRAHLVFGVSATEVDHLSIVADGGTGVAFSATTGILRHATLVGLDEAISADLAGAEVHASIIAGNQVAFAGVLGAVDLYDSATFDNCSRGPAAGSVVREVSASNGFLRYHPDLAAAATDVRLAPGSPLADVLSGCQEDDGTACDLGAYGAAGRDRDARTYQDVDADGLYDAWECLASDDPACRCFDDARYQCDASNFVGLDPAGDADGDGATEAQELSRSTLPQVPDTDGDGLLDGSDADPLDADPASGACD